VTQQELDLLKFAASRSAERGACAAQIVGRDSGDANRGGILFEHLPDDLLSQALTGDAPAPISLGGRYDRRRRQRRPCMVTFAMALYCDSFSAFEIMRNWPVAAG
jgi:hypothetical protein